MRSITDIWNAIKNVFLDFQWTFAVEAVFFFLIMYFVFKTLAENNAKKLIPVYLLLILCVGVLTLFSAHFDVTSFYVFFLLVSLFFLHLENA